MSRWQWLPQACLWPAQRSQISQSTRDRRRKKVRLIPLHLQIRRLPLQQQTRRLPLQQQTRRLPLQQQTRRLPLQQQTRRLPLQQQTHRLLIRLLIRLPLSHKGRQRA
ncbi:MAG: hypothetical protein ACXWDF_08620 [Aeromicrobium sp.]